MHFITNLLFCIFLQLHEIAPTPSTGTASKYDFTNVYNDTIIGIFRGIDYDEKAKQMLEKIKPKTDYKYEMENTQKLKPFGKKIIFRNIDISANGDSKPEHKYRDFAANKTYIAYKQVEFTVTADMCVKPDKSYAHYRGFITYYNFALTGTQLSSNKGDDTEIQIDISYDQLSSDKGNRLEYCDEIPYKKQLQLIYTASAALPSILEDCSRHKDVSGLLEKSFDRNPKQEIISSYPEFLQDEYQYYYRIPTIPFVYINLNDVKLRGLSNFKSYGLNKTFGNDGYTLTMGDVRGDMSLDHGFKNIPAFQLNFTVDNLTVSFDEETRRIRVEARDYSIIQATSESVISLSSWLDKFSVVLMEHFESAMAHSLMPSMGVLRIYGPSSSSNMREMERTIVQMLKNVTTS